MFFKINFHKSIICRMIVGYYAWQQKEDQKEDTSTALIFQEQLFTSALFEDTQDNVIIQRGFFHHIYHIGCAF